MSGRDPIYDGQVADWLRLIAARVEREGIDSLSPMQAFYVGCLIGQTMRLREEEKAREQPTEVRDGS